MHTTWKRFPAVTTGGKAYFWTRYTTDGKRLSVVWDRQVLAWAARVEVKGRCNFNYDGQLVDFTTTATQGKRSIDAALAAGSI